MFASQTIFLTCSYTPPKSKSDNYNQYSEAITYISSLTSECNQLIVLHTYLALTPEIGQGLGRILSCGARKQEQT